MLRPALPALVLLQMAVAAGACAALSLWPPENGRLLLIPLGDHDASHVAQVAIGGGARLLGSGPFAGSLVVVGRRRSLANAIGSTGIVMMAAPRAGCGDPVPPA